MKMWASNTPAHIESVIYFSCLYLFSYLQDEIHDSIEDAKTSLLLYRRYKALAAEGPERVSAVLHDLYQYGHRNNWTIGMDKLPSNAR